MHHVLYTESTDVVLKTTNKSFLTRYFEQPLIDSDLTGLDLAVGEFISLLTQLLGKLQTNNDVLNRIIKFISRQF